MSTFNLYIYHSHTFSQHLYYRKNVTFSKRFLNKLPQCVEMITNDQIKHF